MKTLMKLILLTGAVLGFLITAAYAKPNYFPLQEGYWWKYQGKDGKETMVKVAASSKEPDGTTLYQCVFTVEGKDILEQWYSNPKGWIYDKKFFVPDKNLTQVYSPPYKYLRDPLRVRKSWQWRSSKKDQSTKKLSWKKRLLSFLLAPFLPPSGQIKCVVKAAEKVSVPAGQFTAIRVERTAKSRRERPDTDTEWYADNVGLVKFTSSNRIIELTDYSFKQK